MDLYSPINRKTRYISLRIGCSIGLVSLILFLACSSGHPQQSIQPSVPVKVTTVRERDVPVQIHAIGNVEAYSTVSVKTQVAGELIGVYFKEGQEVKKGDLLFLIDPRPFEAALKQAEANLAKDVAQMKKAEVDARRYTDLFKKGVVSSQDYDQVRTNYETLKAIVKADEAAVRNAKLELEYCYIRSPIDGRIGRLMVNQGNIVKEKETVLVDINQTKPIYVGFSVPEQELPRIKRYMALEELRVQAIIPSDKDHPVTGKLSFINNEVDTKTGTILLKAVFPNQDETLWPGQFVNAVLTLTTQKNALVIPSSAVQMGQEGQYVFVVKPDLTVESRPVVVGDSLEQWVVVSKGLRPGERVVTEGQLSLAPGAKVEIKNGPEGASKEARNGTG